MQVLHRQHQGPTLTGVQDDLPQQGKVCTRRSWGLMSARAATSPGTSRNWRNKGTPLSETIPAACNRCWMVAVMASRAAVSGRFQSCRSRSCTGR